MTTQTEALKLALEAIEHLSHNARKAGVEMGLAFVVADEAITAIKEALAQPEQEPVATAFDVTIEDAALKMLDDMISPSLDDDCNPVRLIAGKGHSGYGLYICSADYPDEGAELLVEIPCLYTTPPQPKEPEQEPTAITYREVFEAMQSLYKGTLKQQAIAVELEKRKLYTTPLQRKPWMSLTEQDIIDLCDGTLTTWEQVRIARAIEAKLRELNEAPQRKE